MTPPTRDIGILILLDAVKLQKAEGKDPIFDVDDVKEMVKHTICLEYEEVSDVTPDVRLTFYNAGHVLGSSQVHLHVGNGLHNIVYGGDMKFGKTSLLDPANSKFPRVETLILEATYGGKDCVPVPGYQADKSMIELITKTLDRGGKVLIPTLGSGRAQEIMLMVEKLIREKSIADIPVYIDGMVWDITAISTAYPEYLNANIRRQIFHKDQNPFLAKCFKRVGSVKERRQIVEDEGPCVIIATSGMLVGGPSVEYLRDLGDNPKNTLIFTCYQGDGSMGQRIQRGEREFTFKKDGRTEIVQLKMEIERLEISGHSDRNELMDFIKKCHPRPKKVITLHGENSRCLDLASGIHKAFRIETVAPRTLDTLRLR